MHLLIYGANGFTGKLVARLAKKLNHSPVLAGRSENSVRPLAEELGLKWLAFDLNSIPRLQNIKAVLNCAGPFSRTAPAWMDACLSQHLHYLDITGEISVFETAISLSQRAREAGVVILPGVGFDVVPTDCLALSLKEAMPDATALELAFWAHSSASRGTVKTMIENLPAGGKERVNGELLSVPMFHKTRLVKFQSGEADCAAIPWGDLATAYVSTKIPNIVVYSAHPPGFVTLARLIHPMRSWFGLKPVQKILKAAAEKFVRGPTQFEQEHSIVDVWGRVSGPSGSKEKTLQVPEGYRFTAEASLAASLRVLKSELSGDTSGYLTPAQAFGSGFLETLLRGDSINQSKP